MPSFGVPFHRPSEYLRGITAPAALPVNPGAMIVRLSWPMR